MFNFFDTSFWLSLVLIVGGILVLIACIRYKNGKYVLKGLAYVALFIFLVITAYCGIQLSYYYSASGGVWGEINNYFNPNQVQYVDKYTFELENLVLKQEKDDTYSATITANVALKLDTNKTVDIYVNDIPCSEVDYSVDYAITDYTYNFYDDNKDLVLSDKLGIRFAFYENSITLKITTQGGQTAVDYWNSYLAKNSFNIKFVESEKTSDNVDIIVDETNGYKTIKFYAGDEVVLMQSLKTGSILTVPKYINQQTTGVLYFDKELTEKIDIDTFKVTDNIDIYTQKATLDKLEFATTTAGVVYTISLKPGATGDVVLPNQYQDSVSLIISDFSNSEISSVTVSEKVIGISASSFKGCSNLTEINVVEENANFSSINGVLYNKEQTKLIYYPLGKSTEEILLPTSVVEIGEYCFYDNSKLQTFDFTNILKINDYAFYKTGLTGSLKLYATLIGASAFENSDKIETLQFYSNGTISIEDKAFKGCMLLETVYFRGQSDLSYVGSDVFTAVEEVRILTDTATNLFIQLTSFDSFGGLISKINKIYIDKDLFDNNQNEFLKNQDNFTRSLSGAFYILTRV